MSDGSATGSSGETAIGDQCYRRSKSHTCDGRGRIQHLSHTRAALRTFVADDNNITGNDLTALDCLDGIFFTIEDSCRAGVLHHLRNDCGTLNNRSVRSQVTLKDSQSASLHIRIIHRSDHLRIQIDCILDGLADGHAINGHALGIDQTDIREFLHNGIDTTCLVQVFHVGRTCRCQMAEVRGLLRDGICEGDIEIKTDLMSNRGQMQHGVGRASQCHINRQGIKYCILGHNLTGSDALLQQVHYRVTCLLCQTKSCRIYSRDGSVTTKSHTKCLGKAVHGVCGIHTGTGSTGRTNLLFVLSYFFLTHGTRCIGSNSLEHGGEGTLLPMDVTCQHRSAGYEYGRQIQSGRGH